MFLCISFFYSGVALAGDPFQTEKEINSSDKEYFTKLIERTTLGSFIPKHFFYTPNDLLGVVIEKDNNPNNKEILWILPSKKIILNGNAYSFAC